MQYELIFRGSLVQYWQAIHTGWQRAIRKNSQGQEPFRLSHARPPRKYEELTIEFLDDNRRRSLITVDALSGADGNFVKLIVHIEREAYENNAGSALAKWNKLKGTWERKGWLFDPLARVQQRVAKPKSPAKPKHGSRLDLWFDWLHSMQAAGLKCTLKQVAQETGYSYGRVRQLHAVYSKSKAGRSGERHNKK